MKTALLLVAHGSPRANSNDALYALAEALGKRHVYEPVEVGFLQFSQPDVPEAVERCVKAGAQRIVAVPYFLNSGRHVAEDLPRVFDEQRARYPHVELIQTSYLGAAPQLAEVLWEMARQALEKNE